MQLAAALKLAEKIAAELLPFCDRLEIAGSIRRQRPNVNDIDLVCIPKDRAKLRERIARKCLIRSDGDQAIIADLPTLSGAPPFQLDLWLAHGEKRDLLGAEDSNFGTLWLCRTGSKHFNIWFARQAQMRDLHWNPHRGLFAGHALVCCSREEDLFAALDIPFINPVDRER